jgi:hypothetical protein
MFHNYISLGEYVCGWEGVEKFDDEAVMQAINISSRRGRRKRHKEEGSSLSAPHYPISNFNLGPDPFVQDFS